MSISNYKYLLKTKQNRVQGKRRAARPSSEDATLRDKLAMLMYGVTGWRPWAQQSVQNPDLQYQTGVLFMLEDQTGSLPIAFLVFSGHICSSQFMIGPRMPSVNIYRRNLRKIRISIKANMQNQIEHVCSFKTFFHPLAMTSCSGKAFGTCLTLAPAQTAP